MNRRKFLKVLVVGAVSTMAASCRIALPGPAPRPFNFNATEIPDYECGKLYDCGVGELRYLETETLPDPGTFKPVTRKVERAVAAEATKDKIAAIKRCMDQLDKMDVPREDRWVSRPEEYWLMNNLYPNPAGQYVVGDRISFHTDTEGAETWVVEGEHNGTLIARKLS